MKKIIIPGILQESTTTCPKCHCVFSYDPEDTISSYSNNFVSCPCCQNLIISYIFPQRITTLQLQGGIKTTDATE